MVDGSAGEVEAVSQEVADTRSLLEASFSFEVADQKQLDFDAYRGGMRWEQKKRAEQVTLLLQNYTTQQSKRNDYKETAKPKIVRFLLSLIGVFAFAMVVAVVLGIVHGVDSLTLGALVAGCVTFLGSIITVLVIIVKYLFPENEEANFNDLVKSIIANDTERMKSENENKLDEMK